MKELELKLAIQKAENEAFWERTKAKTEHNDGTRITKVQGYVPIKNEIEQLLEAGKRVEQLREGIYDWQDDSRIDLDMIDPTRHPSFSMADALIAMRDAEKTAKKLSRDTSQKTPETSEKGSRSEVSSGDNSVKSENRQEALNEPNLGGKI